MDTDDQMAGRILSRRAALLAAARAGVVVVAGGALARRASAAAGATTRPVLHLVATPTLTEGPFFVDEKLNRADLTAGTDRPAVVRGAPLLLTFTAYKLSGREHAPLPDAQVDLWHADAAGVYSDESDPMNPENTARQTWLRGYQLTDGSGAAGFRTIFPGWYEGRAPHIHFKVRLLSGDGKTTAELTSQLFFRDEDAGRVYAHPPYNARDGQYTGNRDDGIYNERQPDGTIAGDQLVLDLKKNPDGAGYAASFAIALTDANLRPGGRGRRRGGDGRPPGGPWGLPPGADRGG